MTLLAEVTFFHPYNLFLAENSQISILQALVDLSKNTIPTVKSAVCCIIEKQQTICDFKCLKGTFGIHDYKSKS